MELESNTAKLRRVDDPDGDTILVALERLRRCPNEVADDFWPPDKRKPVAKKRRGAPALQPSGTETCATETQRVSGSGEGTAREGQPEASDTDTAPGDMPTNLSARHSQAGCGVGESDGRKGPRRAKKTVNSKRGASQESADLDDSTGGSHPQHHTQAPAGATAERSKWEGRLRHHTRQRCETPAEDG